MLWDQNLQCRHAVVDNLVVDNNPEVAVEDNILVEDNTLAEAVDDILAVGTETGDELEADEVEAGDEVEADEVVEVDDETVVPDGAEVVDVDEPGRGRKQSEPGFQSR